MGIPGRTVRHWFCKGVSKRVPSKRGLEKISDFLRKQVPLETPLKVDHSKVQIEKKNVEKIRLILLTLQLELEWFKDGDSTRRDVLRENLDFMDVGYITSMLSMLSDEDSFRRWEAFTTYQFNFFKGGP